MIVENENRVSSPSWPTPVKCEMNIEEWKIQLSQYKLQNEFGFLIQGFECGFDQGIPDHVIPGLRWYCPKNHTSALLAREKIDKNFEKELKAGRIFWPLQARICV